MPLQSRKRNSRAFPEGLSRGLLGAFAAGTSRGLLPLEWVRLSPSTPKACAVSKTQVDKLDLYLSRIRYIASKFKLSPSSLLSLGNCKGVGFTRLNWYIGVDRPSVEVNKVNSSIS